MLYPHFQNPAKSQSCDIENVGTIFFLGALTDVLDLPWRVVLEDAMAAGVGADRGSWGRRGGVHTFLAHLAV